MNEKKISIHPRKLARKMARAQLDRAGATGYNKERLDRFGRKMPSAFSRKWEALAVQARDEAMAREKAKKARRAAR